MEKLKHLIHPHRNRANRPLSISQFRHWAVAFVVCNFNVDIGPEVELVYPPNTPFSQADLTAICFNSFPERQDTETGEDLAFQFSIHNHSPDIALSSPCSPYGSPNTFFGHCIFRQEYDHTMKRSFNQRSLVLISNHDFPSLFIRLIQHVTSTGVISDPTALETAAREMSTWPAPTIGRLELPFMGTLISLEVSPHPALPLQGLSSPLPKSLGYRPDMPSINAYEPVGSWKALAPLMPSLSELYVIWEKLILCESVVVLSKCPQFCSEFVSAVNDLIRPIPYAGERRPFMIMQSEFNTPASESGIPQHFLIGITNPFLLKRILTSRGYEGNPHVIYLKDTEESVPIKRHRSQLDRTPTGLDIPGGIDAQPAPKRFTKSDHGFLQELTDALGLDDPAQGDVSPLIRRHFAELTAQFLAPINRFFATSMAPNLTVAGSASAISTFPIAEFLQSLSKYGSSVKFRGQSSLLRHRTRDKFYEAFCRAPNFRSWLDMKLSLEKEASAGLFGTDPAASRP